MKITPTVYQTCRWRARIFSLASGRSHLKIRGPCDGRRRRRPGPLLPPFRGEVGRGVRRAGARARPATGGPPFPPSRPPSAGGAARVRRRSGDSPVRPAEPGSTPLPTSPLPGGRRRHRPAEPGAADGRPVRASSRSTLLPLPRGGDWSAGPGATPGGRGFRPGADPLPEPSPGRGRESGPARECRRRRRPRRRTRGERPPRAGLRGRRIRAIERLSRIGRPPCTASGRAVRVPCRGPPAA